MYKIVCSDGYAQKKVAPFTLSQAGVNAAFGFAVSQEGAQNFPHLWYLENSKSQPLKIQMDPLGNKQHYLLYPRLPFNRDLKKFAMPQNTIDAGNPQHRHV